MNRRDSEFSIAVELLPGSLPEKLEAPVVETGKLDLDAVDVFGLETGLPKQTRKGLGRSDQAIPRWSPSGGTLAENRVDPRPELPELEIRRAFEAPVEDWNEPVDLRAVQDLGRIFGDESQADLRSRQRLLRSAACEPDGYQHQNQQRSGPGFHQLEPFLGETRERGMTSPLLFRVGDEAAGGARRRRPSA